MRGLPAKLFSFLLPLVILLCFILPFRTVPLGMDVNLPIPGYAMLSGFAFTADGSNILVPPQVLLIAGVAGAVLMLLLALYRNLRRGQGVEGLMALSGVLCFVGFVGQSLLEPGAYAANQSMPKIVRQLFDGQPEAGFIIAMIAAVALAGLSVALYFSESASGERLWAKMIKNKLNTAMAVTAGLALLMFVTPLKSIDLGKGEKMVVYGFSLLTGTVVSSGGVNAVIPPQPLLLAFALLALATIALAFVKLPKGIRFLNIVVPVLAAMFIFSQILYEMFVYNTDTALPMFVRQLLSGKYSLLAFCAVGALIVAAVVGFLRAIIEHNQKSGKRLLDYSTLFLFMLPGIILFFLFNYLPMFGVVMAFQKFDPVTGFFKSQWVGMQNFYEIFKLPAFLLAFRNTLIIATIRLVIEFPMPIIFALLLNEIRVIKFKRIVQSISYLPNFISWVIVSGIWYQMLSPETGIVNQALLALGLAKDSIFFMQTKSLFYPVLIFTSVWKSLGFSSILYMASIAGIDQEQYEAAVMDGAGRIRQMIHITLPGMKNTIVLLFILSVAGLLNAGFDQLWTMSNAAVRDISEILDTLVLRYLTRGSFRDLSLGAAMGTFKAVVGLILFFVANAVSRKLNQESLI